jgi:undecaprenyl-diphosphatase
MVSLVQSIILSVIQGITEWFPISSSGHLALVQNYFGFQNISFDVFLHLASIFAVMIIFWKDILKLFDLRKKENFRYIYLIIIATIPAGIIGYLFKETIGGFFSSMIYLGIFFMISGILVYSTKFSREKKENINFLDSVFIGIFQAIAILPGISRSGATISSSMHRGIKKEEAVKFSFLMAIPVVLGASFLELKNLNVSGVSYFVLILSFFITLIVSLVAIKTLMRIIKSDKFYLFGIYNFLLGVLVLALSFWK